MIESLKNRGKYLKPLVNNIFSLGINKKINVNYIRINSCLRHKKYLFNFIFIWTSLNSLNFKICNWRLRWKGKINSYLECISISKWLWRKLETGKYYVLSLSLKSWSVCLNYVKIIIFHRNFYMLNKIPLLMIFFISKVDESFFLLLFV